MVPTPPCKKPTLKVSAQPLFTGLIYLFVESEGVRRRRGGFQSERWHLFFFAVGDEEKEEGARVRKR